MRDKQKLHTPVLDTMVVLRELSYSHTYLHTNYGNIFTVGAHTRRTSAWTKSRDQLSVFPLKRVLACVE